MTKIVRNAKRNRPKSWEEPDFSNWLWENTDKTSIPGCFLWTGQVDKNGYGCVWKRVNGRNMPDRIYRLTYLKFVGPLKYKNNHIHHKCHNKLCWNPGHLEQLTPEDHAAEHTKDNTPDAA